MMQQPIISIIVPCYNSEPYLDRFFKSILNQTFKDFELIIVNDASTDQTGKICENIAAQYEFVKVFHNERNGGLSVARNVGLNHVAGSYISFIDPDDAIDAAFLEKMYDFSEENKCDIVVCEMSKIYKNKPIGNIIFEYQTKVPDKKIVMQDLFDEKIGSHACNRLFKKTLMETKRFTPGRVYGEDIAIMHEIFDEANRIGFIAEPLYLYYMNETSLSKLYRQFKWMSLYLAFKERLEFAEKKYPSEILGKLTCDTVNMARLTLDNYLIRRDSCDEPYLPEVIDRIKKQKGKTGKLLHMKWRNRMMLRYYNFSPFLYARSIKIIHKIFYKFNPPIFS